jgi:hypothetical protein
LVDRNDGIDRAELTQVIGEAARLLSGDDIAREKNKASRLLLAD